MLTNLFTISIFLILISLTLYFLKTPKSVIEKITYCLGIFVFIFFSLTYAIIDYLTESGITEAALYHLKFGIRYGLSQAGILEHFNLVLIILMVLIPSMILSILLFIKKPVKTKTKKDSIIILSCLILALILNPITLTIYDELINKNYLSNRPSNIYGLVIHQDINIDESKIEFELDSEFYNYYKKPEINQINKPKNLVFIYAESFEKTFFNEDIFPGLIQHLNQIKSESISFTNIIEGELEPIVRYTMGGVVTSQCGFPPITPSLGNTMSGLNTYLEGAICLGDLLSKENYYLAYYGGADLNFAGKGNFFLTHGFNEIMGRHELMPKLQEKSYVNQWGLYDDSLFDITYERFVELSETKDKFALFVLTLDTHHPKGYPSASCKDIIYQDGQNEMLNAVACADYLIAEFIKKIRESEYSDDTVIVVISDHLAIRNTATHLLNQAERTNLFFINEPNLNHENLKINNLGSMMDIAPTILPFIGYQAHLGFGRDLINRNENDLEILEMHKNMYKWRNYLLEFWRFPKINHFILFDYKKKELYIDDRKFHAPILIEINQDLETILKFRFDNPAPYGLVSEIIPDQYYVLIDKCKELSIIGEIKDHNPFDDTSFCLFMGTKKEHEIKKINSNIILTVEEIIENKFALKNQYKVH